MISAASKKKLCQIGRLVLLGINGSVVDDATRRESCDPRLVKAAMQAAVATAMQTPSPTMRTLSTFSLPRGVSP